MLDESPAAQRAVVRIRPLRKSNQWKPVSAAEAIRLTPLDEAADDTAEMSMALGDLRARWLASQAAARETHRRRLLIAAAFVAAAVPWGYLVVVGLG